MSSITEALVSERLAEAPTANAAFAPDRTAQPAPPFQGSVKLQASTLRTAPLLDAPLIGGRDARLFPGVQLEFFTLGDRLVPVQRGAMVRESDAGAAASYWCAIPQIGRVWRQPGDGEWSRAAFPIMLVNDTENHARQGLALFLYRPDRISAMTLQFVQQSSPYLIPQYFVAWGKAAAEYQPADARGLDSMREQAQREIADRIPARPWTDLLAQVPPGTLDGFGGPLGPSTRVAAALLFQGALYYMDCETPYGAYPYPLEMRFGVRSVTKGVFAPLALLHLAEIYGPSVLSLTIGDHVRGLDRKWRRVRFLDAANMASGFGGTGSTRTQPNDIYDGYLGGDYDAWYTAPSLQEKLRLINAQGHPYPWEPGTVVRYRDQDYFLLGVALDHWLRSLRGPGADLGLMIREQILEPIGIHQAPAVRTRESDGQEGILWCNAGYYPTLDDLAKIARLYQSRGEHAGVQILHRALTEALLSGRLLHSKQSRYAMGLHFVPHIDSHGRPTFLPSLRGSGDDEVILHPSGAVSILMARAPADALRIAAPRSEERHPTIQAVERLAAL